MLSVDIYNVAGEKVLAISDTLISDMMTGAGLYYKGEPAGEFNPSYEPLEIRLYGVNLPGQPAGAYSVFHWSGANQQGQSVSSGLYYVILSTRDSYGSEIKKTLEVQVISTTEYAKVTVYNSAGEIVRIFEKPISSSVSTMLSVRDTVVVGENGGVILIGYAPGEYFEWDGKNEQGELVGNGVYEIKAEQKFETGYISVAAKSITVLREKAGTTIENLRISPNPYVFVKGSQGVIRINWTSAYSGTVSFKVYNTSGELINRFRKDLSSGLAEWVPVTTGGSRASSGVYILVIEALRNSGERQMLIEKIAVIRRY